MKKIFFVLSVFLVMVALVKCSNEGKEKLTGIWKLNIMDINNTPLQGSSLGNWLWEFNDEGGYLVNVAGAVEKGTYKINKDKLTLSSVTNKDRPKQIYIITKLDSSSLNLVTASDKNKTSLYFIKMRGKDVGEKD